MPSRCYVGAIGDDDLDRQNILKSNQCQGQNPVQEQVATEIKELNFYGEVSRDLTTDLSLKIVGFESGKVKCVGKESVDLPQQKDSGLCWQ